MRHLIYLGTRAPSAPVDDADPVRRALEEEMQSPAYESIMAAAQHVVYDTRADVTSRVFQAIKPAIQTTKNGDQTPATRLPRF